MPVDLSSGGVRVRVEGLRKTLRALEAAGNSAADLKSVMHAIGDTVVQAASPATPVRTGALAASLRAGRSKTSAVVRAGGARVPYAGVIHYGYPQRNITAQPFLTDALQATRNDVFTQLDEAISSMLHKHQLK